MERELRELRISDTENKNRKKEEQLPTASMALEKKNKELDKWEAKFKERGRNISPKKRESKQNLSLRTRESMI